MGHSWEKQLDKYLENATGESMAACQTLCATRGVDATTPPAVAKALWITGLRVRALKILGTNPTQESYQRATQAIDEALK